MGEAPAISTYIMIVLRPPTCDFMVKIIDFFLLQSEV